MIEDPIVPTDDGYYVCRCEEEFVNIFDFLEHNGVEYEWGVRITKKYNFDMFEFMKNIDKFLRDGDAKAVFECLQSAALTLINASEGKFEEFMEEAIVAGEMEDIYKGVEKLLKEEKDEE